MNANKIKILYEKVPRSIKFMLTPFFIKKMVDNRIFIETIKEVQRFESLQQEERQILQLNKMKDLLIYSYENIPFYKQRFDDANFDPYSFSDFEQMNQIPLLEKADAIAAGDTIYSTDSKLDYYETFTGGSSGQALRLLLDQESIYKERAYVCNFLMKHGYDLCKTRTVAFWGHNKTDDYYYSPLKNEIVISPFRLFKEEELEGICRDIEKFGAEFIAGYPSAIYTFARLLNKAGRKMRFKEAVFYAENFSEDERVYIEKTFKCESCSYYGHTERAVFAELEKGQWVFQDSYGFTELVSTENQGESRIVCTGFLNKKMPLIRYATDDVIEVDEQGKCKLVGHKRSDVYLVAKNGAPIFKGAMTLHLAELSDITRYQYYQTEPGKALLRLMSNQPLSTTEKNKVLSYLKRRTEGLLDIEIVQVDNIELTARGKERWAIVELDNKD